MGKGRGMQGQGMPGNMNNLLKQAQRMQRQMQEKQADLETQEFEASVGGGVVRVVVSGRKEIKSVEIKPEVVDPDDIETLQDLVMAAVNEALRIADETVTRELEEITGGMGIPNGLF